MSAVDTANANRRAFTRRPTKSRIRVVCRKGSMDLGPNIAKVVLDVSESGIRLVSKVLLKIGDEVTVSLESSTHMRPVVRTGLVSWAVPTAGGDCCVGVALQKYLAYSDIRQLT